MRPKFLLDENISAAYWHAIATYNESAAIPIDVIRVGDRDDLPKGMKDPELLLWAELHGHILVSHDKKTLRTHLADHLARGHHLPGLFLLGVHSSVQNIVELLAVAARSEDAGEWQDLIEFLT